MKRHQLVIELVIVLLPIIVFVACKPSASTADANPSTAAQKLDQSKQEAKAAVSDLNDYAYAKKTEFVKKMREELAEVNKEIDEVGAKIAFAADEVKAAAQPKLDALHAQAEKLKAQLDKAEDATEETWNSFKDSASKAFADLKKSSDEARKWLSEKIAPKSA